MKRQRRLANLGAEVQKRHSPTSPDTTVEVHPRSHPRIARVSHWAARPLNFALARTGRDTELIALVDADHQGDPHFLADVVGHFADPRLAVVQTLYDYRDWRHRRFLTACFWAYRVGFPTVMRSTNERGAAFPMGAMCVLRRSAVEQLGGWSERVVTEDSELGVRLHAAGCTSPLLEANYGKELVPERFADFAGQRFRWVYGPVQAFKEHWRTLVPGLRPSCLSRSQQLLGLHHGIGQVRITGTFLTLPLAAAAMWSMIANDDAWPISAKAVLAVAVGLAVYPLCGRPPAATRQVHGGGTAPQRSPRSPRSSSPMP